MTKKIKLSQTNRFSPKTSGIVQKQTATVFYNENEDCEWIELSHDGETLNMSLESWRRLTELAGAARLADEQNVIAKPYENI